MAPNVATSSRISGIRGRYDPHEYDRYLWLSVGTMMRNRSSHMPTTTPHEAITQPVTVRSRLNDRMQSGDTKLQTTMVQESGANEPVCVVQNTDISADSLPYHVVRRSAKTK